MAPLDASRDQSNDLVLEVDLPPRQSFREPQRKGFLSAKIIVFAATVLDPRTYLHLLRIAHYYGYSHVREKRRMKIGKDTRLAPNVSLRNGCRIRIGNHCHIGERTCLWAGNEQGQIVIGDDVSLAPEVFITASDYQFKAGKRFREQPRRERDVIIGSDVWLGARVIVKAGVSIGDGCIVGAGAVVTRDLPPGTVAVGVPARATGVRSDTGKTK